MRHFRRKNRRDFGGSGDLELPNFGWRKLAGGVPIYHVLNKRATCAKKKKKNSKSVGYRVGRV